MTEPEHKSHDEIKREIEAASEQIELGATYVHFKNGLSYKPLQFATLESSNELCVVYQGQYGYKLIFVRPVSEWLADVEYEGKKSKRFIKT